MLTFTLTTKALERFNSTAQARNRAWHQVLTQEDVERCQRAEAIMKGAQS